MRFKKRGLFTSRRADSTHQLIFIIAEGIFFGLFAFLMFSYVNNLAKDPTFQKNFLARDIALTLDTAYASPSDLFYIYPYSPTNFSSYTLRLADEKVELGEKGTGKRSISYRFADTKADKAKLERLDTIDTIILNKTREAPLRIIPVKTQVEDEIR
jgi:hypothetical protein